MTTLTNDGLLTNNIVVGACFGGKVVTVIGLDEPNLTGQLVGIPDVIDSPAGVFTVCDDETEDCRKGLSILVPAATVAEVLKFAPNETTDDAVLMSLLLLQMPEWTEELIANWLRKHAVLPSVAR